jgi:phosphate transport system permease protein
MKNRLLFSRIIDYLLKTCSLFVLITTIGLVGFIFYAAYPVFLQQGLYFITGSEWNYSTDTYGIRIFLIGTLALTTLTMVLATPLSLFTAIYIAEYAPKVVVSALRPLIELLVGIPSVVYGIFGLFILEDIFESYVDPLIDSTLGFIPFFADVWYNGQSLLLASTILTIMILPTIATIVEDSIRSIPYSYREASFALGANHWQTIKKVILPAAKNGIVLGTVLGLMRAMGETMAVVMLLGNVPQVPRSILDGGVYVMTSKILNDITYHLTEDNARAALFGIAAVLFMLEILFVGVARKIGGRI